MGSPLTRKALITRPHEDAASLAAALVSRGIEPVIEPLLTIEPAPGAAAALTAALPGAQALLFTSSNGVRAFVEALAPEAAAAARGMPVLAVGDATAAAARAAGFRRVESAGGDVADLARLVAARMSPGEGALVHAAGSVTAGDLAQRLGAAGFALRRVVLYQAVTAAGLSPGLVEAWRVGAIGMALFFSPRTAATFAALAAEAGLGADCRRVVGLALSPAVAAALKGLPWRALRVAAAPRQAALLAELDAVLAQG